VGIDLHEARPDSRQGTGDLIRQASSEGGLACARRSGEHDQAVDRHDLENESLPEFERQERLREQTLAHPFGDLDRRPSGRKVTARQLSLIDYRVHEGLCSSEALALLDRKRELAPR
jgi:hypothetical protein